MYMDSRWLQTAPPAIIAPREALRRLQIGKRQDELLDLALETFPASDPVSVIRIS